MKSSKNKKFEYEKIVICGMGVMGASLGYQILKQKLCRKVVGLVRNKKNASKMLKMNLASEVFDNPECAIPGSDIVILAVPAFAIESQLKAILPFLDKKTLVMDLCSIKENVVKSAEKLLAGKALFLGAHPMTGSEKFGFNNFIKDLYFNAPCILTPTLSSEKSSIKKAKKFWTKIGTNLMVIPAKEHDRVVAFISHLPHVLSYALMECLLKEGEGYSKLFKAAGGSFRDMTRISASLPSLWADILINNKMAVIKSLKKYKKSVEKIENHIINNDMESLGLHLKKIVSGRADLEKKKII